MRRKTTLAFAWAAALLLAFLIGTRFQPEAGPQKETEPAASPPRVQARPPRSVKAASLEAAPVPGLPAPQLSPHPAGSEAQQQWLEKRSSELLELAWNEDRDSMLAILAELRNPDPEIRHVAADATREFGSRDAIPVLRQIAAVAVAPEEKERCLELAEWLELPTLSEHLAAERARRASAPAVPAGQ